MPLTIFHGTLEDGIQLTNAVQRHCACPPPCGAHRALLDQRFVDGVLFGRWLRPRLQREEWQTSGTSRFEPARERS